MITTVSCSWARQHFYEILDRVCLKREVFILTKRDLAMMKITPVTKAVLRRHEIRV